MDKEILVVVKQPGKEPVSKTIPNTLEAYQKEVEGYIECVCFRGYTMVCNEEGKITGLEPNFGFGDDVIMGNVIFTRSNSEGEFVSLNEQDVKKVFALFTCTNCGQCE